MNKKINKLNILQFQDNLLYLNFIIIIKYFFEVIFLNKNNKKKNMKT